MENNMTVPQKVKNRMIIWYSNSTSEYISKRTGSKILKKYLYTYVQSSIIHIGQKVEATQTSIGSWMDKQNVVYT